jgi:acylphosphatase
VTSGRGRPVQQSKRFVVHGRVQGVGYRFFAQRAASGLGLKGYVRNLPDGTVEVYASGDEASLTKLRQELEAGPIGARVERVEEQHAPHNAAVKKYKTFSIEA